MLFNKKTGSGKLVYEFARTEGGEEIGFNDSVTTTFKGHPAYSLARESIQNIIDAVDDKTKPVVAEFRFKKIKGHELPNHEQLGDILESCKNYYNNNQSSVDFFSKAHKVLKENESIGILTISDYNTIGMPGDDDDINGNYYNFLKSSGASQKSGGTGGSFGLGKGAYYASSSFHSIFVSSLYGNNNYVFQGKLRLVTHKKDGVKFQSTGSFGYPGQAPVRNSADIPEFFKRTEKGTDISIIGFYEEGNWAEVITSSVLTNFWLAIHKNKLIVRVGGVEISSKNLEKFMLGKFKEFEKETEDYQNPLQPYMAYISESSISFEKTLPTLGPVTLKILLKENYNKRISFFRETGMQIKKVKYPLPNPFSAVFECENEKGNKVLRAMENPQHNQWDPENAREKTDEVYKNAKKAEKEIREFIRASLKSVFSAEEDEELNIPGLSKYLFIEAQEDQQAFDGSGVNSAGTIDKGQFKRETAREVGVDSAEKVDVEVAHQVRVSKKSVKAIVKGKVGGVGSGNGDGDGLGQGGEEDLAGKEGRLLKNIILRSFALLEKDGSVGHMVVLHGDANTKLSLAVSVGTDDSLAPIAVKNAESSSGESLEVKGSRIYGVKIGDNGSQKVIIHFEDNERYALNIQTYENK